MGGGEWRAPRSGAKGGGTKATRSKAQVIGVVLDADALIALERNNRSIWAAIKLAVSQGSDVIVPSTPSAY